MTPNAILAVFSRIPESWLFDILRDFDRHLKGAPAGTNAQYFYAQMFRETVEADSRRLEFVIPRVTKPL